MVYTKFTMWPTSCKTQLGRCSLWGWIAFPKSTIPPNVLWKATKNNINRCNLKEVWYSITTADPPRRQHTHFINDYIRILSETMLWTTALHPYTYSSPSHQTPFRYSWQSHAYILTLKIWGKHSICPTVSTFWRDLKKRWHHWRPEWCALQ